MKKANKIRTIWADMYFQDFNLKDWEMDYREWREINDMDTTEPITENAVYEYAIDTNSMYVVNERANLNIELPQNIIAIADLGLWNGRRMDCKEIGSNIKNCLYSECDYSKWYVDELGDLRSENKHHDGTNYYLYRVLKDGITDEQCENFKAKIYDGKVTRKDITRYTRRLGDYIAKVYGW